MTDSIAGRSGAKPVWFALAASISIVGLLMTVALPVGGTGSRTGSSSEGAVASWNALEPVHGANPHELVAPPASKSPADDVQPMSQRVRREGGATDTQTQPATKDVPLSDATSDSATSATSDASAETAEQNLTQLRREFEARFEALKKADPRLAMQLLENMGRALETDPEVTLLRAERAAIATLRNLSSAQAQIQASGAIDVDLDGHGEYGTFAELSGGCTLRGSTNPINPPVLSASFRNVQRGVVERAGYFYAIYLPDASGQGLKENYEGGAHIALFQAQAADACERQWCAYAWPVSSEVPGRVFFVNQQGDVMARDNGVPGELTYAGADGPSPDAAFDAISMPGTISGNVAHNKPAHDGGRWIVVN